MKIEELKPSEYLNIAGVPSLRVEQHKGTFYFSTAAVKEFDLKAGQALRIGFCEGHGFVLRFLEEEKDSFILRENKNGVMFTCKRLALKLITHHQSRNKASVLLQIEKNFHKEGAATYHLLKLIDKK